MICKYTMADENLRNAYSDGHRSGRLDRTLGGRSNYAWFGALLDQPGTYSHDYSRGYRDGWFSPRQPLLAYGGSSPLPGAMSHPATFN